MPFLYRASLNKWWFDELYDLLFVRIGGRGRARRCGGSTGVIIDGTVNGIGALTADAGRGIRRIQTGRVQNYALGIAVGLIVMAGRLPRDRGTVGNDGPAAPAAPRR